MGCGWLGLPLAHALIDKGHLVKGSTTSENKMSRLKSKGIQPYLISLSENGISGSIDDFLTDVQVLIINVPPKLRSGQGENYVNKMHILYKVVKRSAVKQIIFVSSTSVYGSIEGEVTERTIPKPSTESGKQLLEAETIFRNAENLQTVILRFGGLMGEDRNPINMLSGRKALPKGNHYVNLIHKLDCIRIIEYILKADLWGKIVNGVYPHHPIKQVYYTAEALKYKLQIPEYKTSKYLLGKKVIPQLLLTTKTFRFENSIKS